MIVQQRQSGLLIASEKAVPPPEHPSRPAIRKALAALAEELANFDQTTHGHLGPFDIETFARDLVECYNDPRAYTISNLYQSARGLADGRQGAF